jgi:cell division septum initiation protein DivIVA
MEETMMLKQNFADQLKAQSEIWKAQVKDYQGRVEQASEQARGEYKKSMEQMQDKAEEARNLAEKVRGANEEAWKDMVGASQKAFVELQRGWADAVSRFQ